MTWKTCPSSLRHICIASIAVRRSTRHASQVQTEPWFPRNICNNSTSPMKANFKAFEQYLFCGCTTDGAYLVCQPLWNCLQAGKRPLHKRRKFCPESRRQSGVCVRSCQVCAIPYSICMIMIDQRSNKSRTLPHSKPAKISLLSL